MSRESLKIIMESLELLRGNWVAFGDTSIGIDLDCACGAYKWKRYYEMTAF